MCILKSSEKKAGQHSIQNSSIQAAAASRFEGWREPVTVICILKSSEKEEGVEGQYIAKRWGAVNVHPLEH